MMIRPHSFTLQKGKTTSHRHPAGLTLVPPLPYAHQPRGLTPVPRLPCPQLEKRCPLSMAVAKYLADR